MANWPKNSENVLQDLVEYLHVDLFLIQIWNCSIKGFMIAMSPIIQTLHDF